MKRRTRVFLRCLYWTLGVSAYLGIAVGLPYSDRADLAADWQWWYISLIIGSVPAVVFSAFKLHGWAFSGEEDR